MNLKKFIKEILTKKETKHNAKYFINKEVVECFTRMEDKDYSLYTNPPLIMHLYIKLKDDLEEYLCATLCENEVSNELNISINLETEQMKQIIKLIANESPYSSKRDDILRFIKAFQKKAYDPEVAKFMAITNNPSSTKQVELDMDTVIADKLKDIERTTVEDILEHMRDCLDENPEDILYDWDDVVERESDLTEVDVTSRSRIVIIDSENETINNLQVIEGNEHQQSEALSIDELKTKITLYINETSEFMNISIKEEVTDYIVDSLLMIMKSYNNINVAYDIIINAFRLALFNEEESVTYHHFALACKYIKFDETYKIIFDSLKIKLESHSLAYEEDYITKK